MDKKLPKRWIGCPIEEEFFGDQRKESKLQRKQASEKDRSKFKKTDREKFKRGIEADIAAKMSEENLREGRVISIIPQGIIIDSKGLQYRCELRGLLKKVKTEMKNLVAVGDIVLFETASDKEGVIAHIKPRYSLLSRADNLSRRKEQLIAANIDLLLITASVLAPPLKPSLIDRYIIAAQKGGLTPIVLINKIDLLQDASNKWSEERKMYEECLKAYALADIPFIPISAKSGEGMKELEMMMKGKASVFSGQSGVGKSSLINTAAGLNLRVGKTVERTRKGAHTTTSAQLLPLPFGGWCIDTPGIKSFGIWNLEKDEIESYFSEIHPIGSQCKFPDCTHTHETECAVQKAVEEGLISHLRFSSYRALIAMIDQRHLRR